MAWVLPQTSNPIRINQLPTLVGFFLTKFSCCVILMFYNPKGIVMFESLEIRKAANGFILVVNTEEEQREYVYDTERKLLRVIKQHLGEKITNDE